MGGPISQVMSSMPVMEGLSVRGQSECGADYIRARERAPSDVQTQRSHAVKAPDPARPAFDIRLGRGLYSRKLQTVVFQRVLSKPNQPHAGESAL